MTNTLPDNPDPAKANKGALLVIFLTVFIDLLGFGIVLPLLPLYGDQFATDPGGWQIGALMASFSLMQFFFSPIWGGLSDRVGRRPVIIFGISGSVVFYALFGIAAMNASLVGLFVARIGAGICGATVSTAQAYIADTTTKENRTRGMALVGMAFGLGFTFGPVLALFAVLGNENDKLGAGPGFAAAALSAVALMCAIFLLPESRKKQVAGKSNGQSNVRSAWWRVEAWREVIGIRGLKWLVAAFATFIFAFALFETSLSLLVKGSKEFPDPPFQFSLTQVCLMFASLGFLSAIVQGAVVRPLSKRVSNARLAITGSIIEVFGFGILAFAAGNASLTMLATGFVVIVCGYACIQPSMYSLLSRWSDPERQGSMLGAAQSANSISRILGAGLGIPLIMVGVTIPSWASMGLMVVALMLLSRAVQFGHDYAEATSSP